MAYSSQGQHLQLVENRGEIGVFAGQASYRGDIASDQQLFKNGFGAYYKKQFNDYGSIRLNYENLQIGAYDLTSNNSYQNARAFSFSRDFHDISLLGEFNFSRYLPGNKRYRFTPYMGVGVGYLLELGEGKKEVTIASNNLGETYILPTVKETKGYIHLPIQLGFKLNLAQRWNIFAEGMFRFVQSDELDYLADEQLIAKSFAAAPTISYNYQGSRSGNDQAFSLKAGISYNLIKIYGEEKWKPGKRSKLASLKDKEASNKTPGFFSRFKFRRK